MKAARPFGKRRPSAEWFRWTPAREAELRRRWAANETPGAIAAAMGTEYGIVARKAYLLGLGRRRDLMSESQKRWHRERPEVARQRAVQVKLAYERPDVKARHAAALARPEVAEKRAEGVRRAYADAEWRKRRNAAVQAGRRRWCARKLVIAAGLPALKANIERVLTLRWSEGMKPRAIHALLCSEQARAV